MKILAVDTATENCSAALWVDGAILVREAEVERGHADRILTMVDELLAEASVSLPQLTAVAFGRGPGSFTGVRLAASVTQGLAFGAGLPVIPVSDLMSVAQRIVGNGAASRVIVCNDARMHEVYWGCFECRADRSLRPVGDEAVGKPSAVTLPASWDDTDISGAGRGFAAYPQLRDALGERLVALDDQILPSAREVAVLAVSEARAGRLLPADSALPVYLRDDVARPK